MYDYQFWNQLGYHSPPSWHPNLCLNVVPLWWLTWHWYWTKKKSSLAHPPNLPQPWSWLILVFWFCRQLQNGPFCYICCISLCRLDSFFMHPIKSLAVLFTVPVLWQFIIFPSCVILFAGPHSPACADLDPPQAVASVKSRVKYPCHNGVPNLFVHNVAKITVVSELLRAPDKCCMVLPTCFVFL